MGMAAGQARLLSITSRMSDNELRAQLINNDKMRLATQSSQVSDAYVQALNDAQLMFTNYDADNNATYQQLTFNSLTAFNPYNNQYAISNASGQVLVSETDAKNFKAANGDLNKFLGMYGLTQTTTYFDNLKSSYDFGDNTIAYSTANVISVTNADGSVSSQTEYLSTGYTAEELEAMYLGGTLSRKDGNGNITTETYAGYFNTISSADYYNYSSALSSFNERYDAYCATIANVMEGELDTIKTTNSNSATSDLTLEDLQDTIKTYKENLEKSETETTVKAPTKEETQKLLTNIQNFIGVASTYSNSSGTTYFNNLIEQIENTGNGKTQYEDFGTVDDEGNSKNQYIYKYDAAANKLYIAVDTVDNGDGTYSLVKDDNDQPVYNYVISVGNGFTLSAYNTEGTTVENEDGKSEIDTSTVGQLIESKSAAYSETATSYSFAIGTGDDAVTIEIPANILNGLKATPPTAPTAIELTEQREPDISNMLETADDVLTSITKAIYSVWDINKFIPEEGDSNYMEYSACCNAAQNLYKTIFGTTYNGDYSTLFALLQDPDEIWQTVRNTLDPSSDQYIAFKNIYEVITLDRVMNTYGEPKTAWIDESNVTDSYNENGDAKAQWYTNLFTRMQEGGYKALQDGLASSTEWIQFAFESGLVTLEQVDSKQAWNTLTYSSCSDITEQTNSEAVAIAEAEYNAAMNKIENKDKMYDLELKNIDTEHNSLQTEYDSIKTAIDKNVERTFKIYS